MLYPIELSACKRVVRPVLSSRGQELNLAIGLRRKVMSLATLRGVVPAQNLLLRLTPWLFLGRSVQLLAVRELALRRRSLTAARASLLGSFLVRLLDGRLLGRLLFITLSHALSSLLLKNSKTFELPRCFGKSWF